MKTSSKIPPHIRWMRYRDLQAVLTIERASFDWPWHKKEFLASNQERNEVNFVAEVDNRVAGYMIYALSKDRIRLLNLAVAVDDRRRGIGRAMIGKLRRKLTICRRRFLFANVRETNLEAQLFFRRLGFQAVEVLRRYFVNHEDAYRFRLDCGGWRARG